MFNPQVQQKIDLIRSNVSISDVLPGVKNNGTSDCPFCKGKGKFYVKNGWARCFRASCELNSGPSLDVIGLYRSINGLTTEKGSFFKALDSMCLEFNLGTSYSSAPTESALDEVAEVYNFELSSKYGKVARDYLVLRGIDIEMADLLKIGYARTNSVLSDYGLDKDLLDSSGLLNQFGEVFSNRVIFPIRDVSGQIKHFTGRYLGPIPQENGEDRLPRWKHSTSSNSGVSDFMGLEENIPSYSNEYVVICEGYMDALSLYQLGIQSVCIFGLYGLMKHLHKLRRFRRIYCAFDIDTFDKDHPLYPNEFKSWRVVIPQLVDMQLLIPSSTIHTCFIPGEGVDKGRGTSFIAKDVNEWVNEFKPDKFKVMNLLEDSPTLTDYLISTKGMSLQYHESLIKLCIATKSDYSVLNQYIPSGMSAIDYAVALLTR